MRLIGLTGGIASGKSAVARMLRRTGVPVVDADQLARDAVLPGTAALAEIRARFGEGVITADGTLDRKALGERVFRDDGARRDLNAIVHPRVAALAVERLEGLRAGGAPIAVYEVPLLFENNLEGMMDATVLVAAAPDVQLRRLMARDGITEEPALARIRTQLPLDEKRRRATAVVENDHTLADTAASLRAAWRTVTGEDVAFEPDA